MLQKEVKWNKFIFATTLLLYLYPARGHDCSALAIICFYTPAIMLCHLLPQTLIVLEPGV